MKNYLSLLHMDGERMRDNLKKIKVVSFLYGDISIDSRVKNILSILSKASEPLDITLLCSQESSEGNYDGFNVINLNLDDRKISHLFFFFKTFIYFLRKKPDIVICHDFYPSISSLLIKLFWNIYLIFDSHELIYKRELKFFSRNAFWTILDSQIIRKCNFLITANASRSKLMKKIYSLDETPYPFENISNIKAFSNKDKKMIEADKIKVVYQGNLGEQRKILQLIEILSRNFKQIEFHIVGFGEELEAIKSLENKRKNLITYGKLSNSEVAKILEKMHVGLISYSWNDLNNKYCASNKLYDYLFSGLIIFSSSQKTLKNLISRNKLGVCFDKDFSEEKLCRDFSFLLDNFADIQNNLKEYNKKHNPVNLSKIQEKNLLREVNERIRYQL